MAAWRRRLLGLPRFHPRGRAEERAGLATARRSRQPASSMSSSQAAVLPVMFGGAAAAARRGLEVALIQNRPVLGGNGSPEIGITPRGENRSLVQELAGPDREQVPRAQSNIHLFLGWHAFRVQRHENRIVSVDAKHTTTNQELRVCMTALIHRSHGNGSIGAWAGAEYRLGGRPAANSTRVWHLRSPTRCTTGIPSCSAPGPPPSPQRSPMFRGRSRSPRITPTCCRVDGHDNVGGLTHFWEYGQWLDPIQDAEQIRDHLLQAVYGTFSNAKHREPQQNANLELASVGYVPATGESRRLVGDYLLTENDIRSQRPFADAVVRSAKDISVCTIRETSTTSGWATGNGSLCHPIRFRCGACTRETSTICSWRASTSA